MASRTRMLEIGRRLQWKDVEGTLADSPELIDVRDEKGRSWLHICCSVNPKVRGLRPADSVRMADVLLNAGLDVNEPAFREGKWNATPFWYAVARGENLSLARHLLERGSDPHHCLWAAAYRDDVAAIKMLVAAGADVDSRCGGRNTLPARRQDESLSGGESVAHSRRTGRLPGQPRTDRSALHASQGPP